MEAKPFSLVFICQTSVIPKKKKRERPMKFWATVCNL